METRQMIYLGGISVLLLIQLLGHIVAAGMNYGVIFPLFGHIGGICGNIQGSAVCIAIFGGFALISIMVYAVAKLLIHVKWAKWCFFLFVGFYSIQFICACIWAAKLPNTSISPYEMAQTANYKAYATALSNYILANPREHDDEIDSWQDKLNSEYCKVPNHCTVAEAHEIDTVKFPYSTAVAFLIIQIITIAVIVGAYFYRNTLFDQQYDSLH